LNRGMTNAWHPNSAAMCNSRRMSRSASEIFGLRFSSGATKQSFSCGGAHIKGVVSSG
jgi:hypothetical protein